MCHAEEEIAVGAASAILRKVDVVSLGQWAPRGTTGHQDYKDSQDCRDAKETRVKGEPPE